MVERARCFQGTGSVACLSYLVMTIQTLYRTMRIYLSATSTCKIYEGKPVQSPLVSSTLWNLSFPKFESYRISTSWPSPIPNLSVASAMLPNLYKTNRTFASPCQMRMLEIPCFSLSLYATLLIQILISTSTRSISIPLLHLGIPTYFSRSLSSFHHPKHLYNLGTKDALFLPQNLTNLISISLPRCCKPSG